MDKNASQTSLEKPSLTVIKKNETEGSNTKLVAIKKLEYKAPILLPPPQEKYIKTKRHDFL